MAKWNEKGGQTVSMMCDLIEEQKVEVASGGIGFQDSGYSEQVVVLNGELRVSKEISDLDKKGLLRSGLMSAGAKGKISAENLIKYISIEERKLLKKPKKFYRLITDISISRHSEIPVVNFEGSRIVINPKPNRKVHEFRRKITRRAREDLVSDLPSFYAPVSVSVRSRSMWTSQGLLDTF